MSIQNVATSYTDHNAELQSIDRQRQLAMLLQNQALQPSDAGGMVGQVYVPQSPLQGMAKMLQMYAAGRMNDRLDERQRGLSADYNNKLAQGLQNYQKTMAGTPAQPEVPAQPERPYSPQMPQEMPLAPTPSAAPQQQPIMQPQQAGQPATPAVPGDPIKANMDLIATGIPLAQQLGVSNIAAAPELEMKRIALAQALEEKQTAREERRHQFEASLADKQQGREDQKALALQLKSMGGGGSQSPYFTPLQTAGGAFAFNARTGKAEPVMGPNGAPLVGAQYDPSLQGNIAGSKASGKEMGESSAKSQIALPQAIDSANVAIKQIDDLISHPGFSSTVGATLRPFASKVDGTPEADFTKRLDQLRGGAFLQAFESLKGGGAITEIEGKKATDAITRMDKAQSEAEFKTAAREFQGVIRNGVERAKRKAGTSSAVTPSTAAPNVSIDDLLNKYK